MFPEHLQPNAGLQLLSGFINAAADANIIAGVQVKLLNEFALQYCKDSYEPLAQGAAPEQQQRQPDAATTAGVDNTLPPPLEQSPAVPSTSLPEAPQLHIQPLNLSAGLGAPTSTGPQEATCFDAAPALAPTSDPAADSLSHHAAALMAFSGSMAGSYDAATAAAAAAALLQQGPYTSTVTGQQQLTEPCPTSAGLLGPSHELLQALGYAADATAAAQAATAAASAAAGAGPNMSAADIAAACKTSGPRKQRFTREQHAAILESVERNYAQYPSRYTELVIKEMQALFPGIELNNACVRKIKFRANEASKQLTPQQQLQQQQEYASALSDYQAADAAHGLVGLASAAAAEAAAGAYIDYAGMPEYTPEPAAAAAVTGQPADCIVKTEAGPVAGTDVGSAQQEGACAASPSAAAAAALDTLQARPAVTPATAAVSMEPEGAAMLAVVEQQQKGPPAPQDASTSTAEAAGRDSRAGSPSSSGLQVKVPEPAARSAAPGEDCVDSATAAAAEAMHLLAGISDSKQQQAAVCADQAIAAAAAGGASDAGAEGSDVAAAVAAAAVVAPAGSGPGGKRKRESGSGGGDGSASGTAASSPLPGQVAEALSAAADLAGTGPAGTTQDQQLQAHNGSVLDPAAAAAYMPAAGQAAYDQQQLLLQRHEQQQQHSLMRQLLQLQQQQQQPAWDLAYSNQLGPLDLHQQALQMQLGAAGLGSSGNLAALQQQMQMQVPAAATAAGQQPAAKRQRLSGAQMAELIASVKHHVQVNPERYTHCVIKDMKEKYPDLELNMGQIRKIKFRTLGNVNCGKQSVKAGSEPTSSAAARGADPAAGAGAAAAAAAGCSGASREF